MQIYRHLLASRRLNTPFILLVILLLIVAVAGGASRPDTTGQVVVRVAAWCVLAIGILAGLRPRFTGYRPVLYLLIAMVALLLMQLVPLPPSLWQALPGRATFADIGADLGQQPWRPWSIVPDLTVNALASLSVPLAVLILIAGSDREPRVWLPGLLLLLILGSALSGLVEFSGGTLDLSLVNKSQWYVSGTFANRNHFALLLAMGCLIAPVWAFVDSRTMTWRVPAAAGLMLLFALTALASGSRAGLLAVVIAFVLGPLIARRAIGKVLARAPRWVFPAIIVSIVIGIAFFVLLSMAADRAASIQRAIALDASQDLRARAFPTVWTMICAYFPFGSGFGGFDSMFRLAEPFELLKRTYFNHAHNDFLEVLLDGGLVAGLILVAAIGWWLVASLRAWRDQHDMLAQLGSALLLLTFVGSAFDYPARTPMIMAMIVISATWLSSNDTARSRPALPAGHQHL